MYGDKLYFCCSSPLEMNGYYRAMQETSKHLTKLKASHQAGFNNDALFLENLKIIFGQDNYLILGQNRQQCGEIENGSNYEKNSWTTSI